MTDSSNRKGLSRRVVLASYAISVAAFLGICLFAVGSLGWDPLTFLAIPTLPLISAPLFDFDGIPACVYPLFLLVLGLLGLCGFVVSVRQPQRRGWFVCGHVCLVVYYVLCALLCISWVLHPPLD